MANNLNANSLRLSVPESATIASAASVTSVAHAGTSKVVTTVVGTNDFLFFVPTGGTAADGYFVPESDWFQEGSGGAVSTRSQFPAGDFKYGDCQPAAFTIPAGARCVVIANINAAIFYARRGTANHVGLTIAKPGDTDGENSQGIAIAPQVASVPGALILSSGDFSPGDKWHLVAGAAAQIAIVNFL